MNLRPTRHQRGSAMITAIMVMGILLVLASGVLLYAQQLGEANQRRAREGRRFDCAASGLQLAKAFYGYNTTAWNTTYLLSGNTKTYNAFDASNWPSPPAATDPFATGAGSLRANHPELFVDLDGDGNADVYLYIRDNMDGDGTMNADADGRVYVGAACVSSTMNPSESSATLKKNVELAEALITPGSQGAPCTQAGCGNGANNLN